tara:strand:+ start:477 stop:1133 length:657 start_codon:yes stop_codon:yes gene_type:complete
MSEKKKRGRKPKNKIILNDSPVFENNKIDDILITCIKKTKQGDLKYEDEIKSYNLEDNKYSDFNPSNINKCWNCSYDIEGEIYSYPKNYKNDIFYLTGNFCCYECAGRYIYEKYDNSEFWDKYYLLNLYTNIIRNTNTQIKIPVSKLRLIEYGGDLNKGEYINSSSVDNDIYVPPTIYVNNEFYKDNITNVKNEFKLFRKNKKKNFIENLTSVPEKGN